MQQSSVKTVGTINSVSNRIQKTIGEIRDFLAVNRVLLYQFLEDGSGEVIAEALSPSRVLDSLLRLRFPASDIPQAARKRFLEQQVRVLVDVGLRRQLHQFPYGGEKAVYTNPSDCHLRYLELLGIKASFTYPIVIRGKLWGLLLIHHSQNKRWQNHELAVLELLSERLNLLITTEELSAEQKALLHREETINILRNLLEPKTTDLPLQKILEIAVSRLNGCGGCIYLEPLSGETAVYMTGKQPCSDKANGKNILESSLECQWCLLDGKTVYLEELNGEVSSHEIYSSSGEKYSALVVSLSSSHYREGYLTIFRLNSPQVIWWAGSPYETSTESKEMRSSFSPWKEERQLPAKDSWSDEEMKLVCAIAQFLKDSFQQQELSSAITFQENYHTLTQLPNRSLFIEQLNLLARSSVTSHEISAVIFLDLDRFQQVNNTLGHTAGDKLLTLVTERLKETLAEDNSFLAHWQGDKFVILLRHLNHLDSEELEQTIAQLGDCFQLPFSLFGHEIYIKASWGVSISPYDGTNAETLLLNAETAMYSAKQQGRNRYQVYSPALRSPLNPLTLEAEIRKSLQNKDFCLYYQPQMNLKTGKIAAIEALIRWQHPERGLLSPYHFIPFAEESDLICEIGNWVLKEACQQLAQWREQGLDNLRVAVNVSARQFQEAEFVDFVKEVLSTTEIPPSALEIEITETTVAQNVNLTHWKLQQLQAMGVSVALDDFGMGYSSLNAIKTFPLDTLKIDRTFIKEIQTSKTDSAIVNCIITLAQGLNLRMVAEGVETLQQLEILQDISCRCEEEDCCQDVQGYFISEPLAPQEATEFLLNSTQEGELFSSQKISTAENQEPSRIFTNSPLNYPQHSGTSPLQQLFNQTRREQLVAQITQQVHASLDLEEVFKVTVEEIHDFLKTDRVLLFRFDEDWNGKVVIESVSPPWDSLCNREIEDPCFQVKCAPLYANGRILAVEDIETAEMTPCYREMLRSFQVRADLVIPILNQESLWGLLIAHHCRGRRHWHPTEISLLQQLATQVGVAIYQAELYQKLQKANQKLEELAIEDGLTEIANRRQFDQTLDHLWKRLYREQKPLALILCDLDYFKDYNDYYGHQAGDDCLKQVAKALEGVGRRPDDLVARYGGEEFAILLPDTPLEKAMMVAQRARKAVAHLAIPHQRSTTADHVTLSLGVSALRPNAMNSRKELIRHADQALYQAKEQGRDRACCNII